MYAPLRISEATVLGIHAAIYLATKPHETATTSEIARFLNASENHLSKVLQRLVKAGVVKSIRGPKGGFLLEKSPAMITLRELYELFEGKMEEISCLLQTPVCGNRCIFGGLLSQMNVLATDFLTRMTLAGAVKQIQEECAD